MKLKLFLTLSAHGCHAMLQGDLPKEYVPVSDVAAWDPCGVKRSND